MCCGVVYCVAVCRIALQFVERMAAAMYEEPGWRHLNSQNHLRHWRNEQAKVVAFVTGLDGRLGNASCMNLLNRDIARQVGRAVFSWS